MQYATTAFGRIPLPVERIPRGDWDAYLRAAKDAAQSAWERGVDYTPITPAESTAAS